MPYEQTQIREVRIYGTASLCNRNVGMANDLNTILAVVSMSGIGLIATMLVIVIGEKFGKRP